MVHSKDQLDLKWIGLGLYSIAEAHQLTCVPGATIRRWLKGYRYRRVDGFAEAPSVWQGDILFDGPRPMLTFLDLLDVRIVDSFRKHGVRWTIIREAARIACDTFGSNHPFSMKRFRTDGRRLFVDLEQDGRRRLLDVSDKQFVFEEAISRTLYDGIEFDNDQAQRWYPLWPNKAIVIDPRVAFGRPITARSGVPADILAAAVNAEASEAVAARVYRVSPSEVRAAVEWHSRQAA